MSETKTCPKCGAELPADAPAGICPKCLMRAGLASEQDAGSGPQMEPTTATSSFVPPQPEELAKHFPQLEILELLGKGGMGAVYKARQPGLDRLVAVKILPPEVGHDPAFAERFTREARALAKLSHPNIVSVFDSGQAHGFYYFVMEYVEGVNLRQTIRAGQLEPEEALAIVPQVCDALQFAHDEGVVHRDIKPENILLDQKGRVKIADFGLAKLLGKAAADFTLTGTHQVMGTPHYMAPEQIEKPLQVDHRADIYSLGVVFYEMLTGELPIGRFEPPSSKVRVDVRLDEVVLRALENEPARRYQKVSDVKTDVERVSRAEKPPQPTLPGVEPIPPDVEQSILSHLPESWTSAVKLYRAKTGAGLDEAFMAVKAIARRHGIEFPPIPLRRHLAMCALMTVMIAIYGTGYLLFRKYVHLSSIITGTVYYVSVTVLTAFFAVSAWRYRRYRDTRRYQATVLAAGLFFFAFFIAPLLGFLAEPEPVLSWAYRVSGAKPGEHDVFLLHTLCAVIIFGTLAWLIRFWFKLRARGRSSDKESTESPRQGRAVVSAADRELIESARRQVRGPAIGLTVAGCMALAMILGAAVWILTAGQSVSRVADATPPGLGLFLSYERQLAPGMGQAGLSFPELALILGIALLKSIPSLILILAAQMMRSLRSYGFAMAGAIMAILPLFGPAWLVSLPLGIWALIVLTRPGVKDAFRKNAAGTGGSSTAASGEGPADQPSVPRATGSGRWAGRLVLLATMVLAGIAFALLRPDISQATWGFWMALLLAAFLVDVVRYRGQPRGLRAAFPLLAGITAMLIGFVVQPEPLLNWLYHIGGVTAGQDDATALRVILGLVAAWLVWQMVQVGRQLGRPLARRLVAAAIMGSMFVIIAALSYFHRRPASPLPSGATATVREIPMTEAERSSPGLSVFRYELKLPPGHDAEFSTELWRHGKSEQSRIHVAGGRAGNGRAELRLQQGETLSPEGKGKLRWDWRADNAGASVETGQWIDDPFAATQGRSSSWRGTEEWQLTPGKEHTLLILLGWEEASVTGVPEPYARNPTAFAEAIEKGDIPRADVELYLKVRVQSK